MNDPHGPDGRDNKAIVQQFYDGLDGRIAEHWVVRDDLAMLQQLGGVPGP